MPPTIKLKLGNLFDGPADVVVLPCSTEVPLPASLPAL